MSGRTLVMTLGNPARGDDGVGQAVYLALTNEDLPGSVVLEDYGMPGLEAALVMSEYDRVIVVDAADMGRAPGYWARFDVDAVRQSTGSAAGGLTLHGAGFLDAAALGKALDILPGEVIIYGIQPQQVSWEEGLSDPVRQAVAPVCRAIVNELKGNTQNGEDTDN